MHHTVIEFMQRLHTTAARLSFIFLAMEGQINVLFFLVVKRIFHCVIGKYFSSGTTP
jgi:hypothetical protein